MGNVLIVDDHDVTCRTLAKLVGHAGHRGQCAFSGEDALKRIRDDLPDLVILDAMMPGMDGLEVLRQIRNDPRTADVPVVIFSAISDPNYQAHALQKGANEYWVKARFNFDELKDRIEKLVT